MQEMYTRTEKLIGTDSMNKLKSAKVLIVGLGGVGGYILESLVRAGVGTVGICDFDTVDPTNLNRQIISVVSEVGKPKTDVCERRILSINPDCKVIKYQFKLNEDKLTEYNIPSWDYIADAIDDVPAKLALIKAALTCGVPMISSMGTGNKLNPFGYKIAPIEKTEGDPLARAIRKKLREEGIKGLEVLYSAEPPVVEGTPKGEAIPSISYMPAIAGLTISSHIIKKLCEK